MIKNSNTLYDATFRSTDERSDDIKVHVQLQDDNTYIVFASDELHIYREDDEVEYHDDQDEAIQAGRDMISRLIDAS